MRSLEPSPSAAGPVVKAVPAPTGGTLRRGRLMEPLRIVGIAGSLRRASYNRGLIRAAVEVALDGMDVEVFDLAAIPLYNQDVEEPASVAALKAAIHDADALLVATPEYNHGIPGVLKNALDWASRPRLSSPLRDKPVAVMGATTGRGSTARAQAQLREAFVFTGACVMPQPELLVGSAASRFDSDGNLVDDEIRDALRALLDGLAGWTVRLGPRRSAA